jgi:hypothetical protein
MSMFGMDSPVQPASPAKAALAGLGVAVAGSMVWGLIAYLTTYQLSLMAVFMGLGVGAVMFRANGRNRSPALAVASAVLAVAGCALGSLVAEILVVLRTGVSFSAIMAHLDLVLKLYPTAVGGLGFLFWVIAALYGYRIAMGQPLWRGGFGRGRRPQAGGQYPGFGTGPGQPQAGGQYPGFGAAPWQPPAAAVDPGPPPAGRADPGQPAAPGTTAPQ